MGGLFSSSKTTKSSNFGQQFGTNTNVNSFSNPALQGFQTNLMGNIQRGMDQSNQPLYGQAQIGSYAGNLNDLANSSIKALRANLARTGGLGGGGAAAGETAIGMGKFGNMSNFMANLPQMNRTAALQAAQTYGGLGNQLMSVAPRSQYGQQYGTNTGTGVSKQTENPSIMGDIGSMIGVAGGFMGMPFMQSFMQPGAARSLIAFLQVQVGRVRRRVDYLLE